jgi:lysophospholipase L1-like esterase
MPQLFLIGDSITWGSWDIAGGGWAQRLRSEIDRYQVAHADLWCPTYNLGIPGDTSAGVLQRMRAEITARLEPNSDPRERPIIVIAIGINDSRSHRGAVDVSPAKYGENLGAIISLARSLTDAVVVVGLFPIDQSLLTPVSWEPTVSYTLERAAAFDTICREQCAAAGVTHVALWSELMQKPGAEPPRELLIDGLHPNERGHELIYQRLRECLRTSKYLVTPFHS